MNAGGLPSYNKKVPIVLRIDSSVGVHGCRSISRTNSKLLEDVLNERASLANGVEVAVFAIGIGHAIGIHHGCVHAPLKTVGMVGNAGDRPIRIAGAALGVG